MKKKYYLSNFGQLFKGFENPDTDKFKEITRDEYLLYLKIAGFAWSGWYNVEQA